MGANVGTLILFPNFLSAFPFSLLISQRHIFLNLKKTNCVIVPHTRSRWVLTNSTSHWAQRRIFQDLSSTFNAQLLHNMAFNSYAVIEARISEACDAIHDGWYTNAHKLQVHNVLIRWLQRRWNGSASKSTRASTNKALKEEHEGAIREYIDRLDKINMCTRPQMMVGAANCQKVKRKSHQ